MSNTGSNSDDDDSNGFFRNVASDEDDRALRIVLQTQCFDLPLPPQIVFFRWEGRSMVMMGQLGKLVDGLRSKMRAGVGGKKKAAAAYEQMGKTDSMRVEIKSRQAQKLIAKNLVAADSMGRRRSRNKRFFLTF
ncbi:hypothetical protein ZWY2020_012444 [Hordeum vulgare]|nr:hypothetical protein ZWY2020_012444 [Hordeum vulgare]